jgi:hypothetical protein
MEEIPTTDIHSQSLGTFVNYGRKELYNIATKANAIKRFIFVNTL